MRHRSAPLSLAFIRSAPLGLALLTTWASLVLGACDVDARLNPNYGCSESCKLCVRDFCLDPPSLRDAAADATLPMDGAVADAAVQCDVTGADDASSSEGSQADCPRGQVCCRGTCALSCNSTCGNALKEEGEECDGGPLCSKSCTLLFDESLIHRYDFAGQGTEVIDSINGATGTVINAQLDGSGDLTLAGGETDQYVDLPNGLTSARSDITIEVWLTWTGTAAGERIFDIGYNSSGEQAHTGVSTTYFYLTPQSASDGDTLAAHINFTQTGNDPEADAFVHWNKALSKGVPHQVVVVFNGTRDIFELYLDGVYLDRIRGVEGMLAMIDARNAWIGRSNSPGPSLKATLHEFRIYKSPLTPTAIMASWEAGTDPE